MPVNSMAQVSGLWHVTGNIDGKAFAVDRQFQPQGARFGGVCTDVATGDGKAKAGKKHVLSAGSVNANGSAVSWTYPVKVMIVSVDIHFNGTLNGNRMAGTIDAKGREGRFTAIRN